MKGSPEGKSIQVIIAHTEGAVGQGGYKISNLHTVHNPFRRGPEGQSRTKGPEYGSCNLSVRNRRPIVLHLFVELSD